MRREGEDLARQGHDRQDRGSAPRTLHRLGGLRSHSHLRQPLLVLLHLPAPQGHAALALRQGRRLSPLVPLRQLHDPDALHRVRPGTRDRREPLAALRLDPLDEPGTARRDAAQSSRGHEPSLAARTTARGHRGARPGGRVPRRERRRTSSSAPCTTSSRSTRN